MNFRDAGLSGMSSKTIYRSATLDEASDADLAAIDTLGIQTVIDLRGNRDKHTESRIETLFHPRNHHDKKDSLGKTLHRVEFSKTIRGAILASLTWYSKIIVFILRLFGLKMYAQRYALQNSFLKNEGLVGLYVSFLRNGGGTIKHVFDIYAEKRNYPILIHCAAGKDRTGVVVALLQAMCGCKRSEIVKDYCKSQELLDLDRVTREITHIGLGEEFSLSPASAMEETLEWINSTYGSVSAYLISVGVSQEQQKMIKSLILENAAI